MKTNNLKPILLTLILFTAVFYTSVAQRVIKGTVYREGQLAAGVTVGAQKTSETFMTSFDGKYELTVPENSKYLTFTFIDESKKRNFAPEDGNEIDFSFDGIIPEKKETETGTVLKSHTDLINERDKVYLENYTFLNQFYDQKNYKMAIGPWRKLYHVYPKSSENIYVKGIVMHQDFIDKSNDQKTKNAYLDTLMQIYDKRIKYFDKKGFNLGRQGIDYFRIKIGDADLLENMSDTQKKSIYSKGYNYVKESVELQKEETEDRVLLLYMQSTRSMFGFGELTKEKVIETYDLVSGYVNKHLAKNPNDETTLSVRDNVDLIFQRSGAADCEALLAIYGAKYATISSNIEELKKMLRMLDRENCTESELYAKASEKLFELEPSAEAAYNMARTFAIAKKLDKAEAYYKQAIELEKDPIKLSSYYYQLTVLTYESSPQQARTNLKKAIDLDPNNGKAYMLLADVYALNAKTVGKSELEHQAVYWVAVDYYGKAKKADPTLEADANERIRIYSLHFPTKDDIFMDENQLTVGQSYTVGGWVNETTTIREKR